MVSKSERQAWDRRGVDALTSIVEKRRHQRIETSIEGHIFLGPTRMDITVVDLSRSGARLQWDNPLDISLQVGDTLDLAFIWPFQGSNCALNVEGKIVRLDTDAIAIKFSHLLEDLGTNH